MRDLRKSFLRALRKASVIGILAIALTASARAECVMETFYSTGSAAIDNWQKLFNDTLKANEKNFEGRTGKVFGFGAGAGYPQIWLRDSATIIPASRYFYAAPWLITWLEEHLYHQNEDGNLFDWIGFGNYNMLKFTGAPHAKRLVKGQNVTLVADKNSVDADQEVSAVVSAYLAYKITGDRHFLLKQVNGMPLIRRLEESLYYLLLHRYDEKTGLITKGYTIDWGDVSIAYDSQSAIYMDDKTLREVNTYTNAYFVLAANALSELYAALENEGNAAFWKKKAEEIKQKINKLLWDEKRGFYRMHILVDKSEKIMDDASFFALGSNALAIQSGVADGKKAARIFENAGALQKKYNFSTISGVLHPPYPDGFFSHFAITKSYTYQNGGQWDWFGGRLILQEFKHGYSDNAYTHLLEIANKNSKGNGLYEWDTPDGKGMGSAQLAGSAGTLAGALFEGYFGVELSHDALNLMPRITRNGKFTVNVFQPSTKQCAHYEMERNENKIMLNYEATVNVNGNLCVAIPHSAKNPSVLLDGNPLKLFPVIRKGADAYVCFLTSWTPHDAVISW